MDLLYFYSVMQLLSKLTFLFLLSCRMDLSHSLEERTDLQKMEEAADGVLPQLLVWVLGPCLCWHVDEVKRNVKTPIFNTFNPFYLLLPC